jgi:hypothetical protein
MNKGPVMLIRIRIRIRDFFNIIVNETNISY